jgi:hypothetical protein
MLKTAVAVLVSAALMFSAPAFAVDGQVLINQSTVLAAGGFPYKIIQPGSYKLSGNLSVITAGTDAIDINADNVVLDMNGFSITSVDTTCTTGSTTPTCTGMITASGIASYRYNNITVRNGSVAGFRAGFNLLGIGNLLEEVHASGNFLGAVVNSGIIRRSTFTNNLNGLEATFTVIQDNFFQFNNVGSFIDHSNISGNTLIQNGTGLNGSFSNYGNNIFGNNTPFGNFRDLGGNTSQHNNNCDGSVC